MCCTIVAVLVLRGVLVVQMPLLIVSLLFGILPLFCGLVLGGGCLCMF